MIDSRELFDAAGPNPHRQASRLIIDGDLAVQLALEAAGVGTWDAVPARGELRWSPRAKTLLGLSPDDEVTPEKFVRSLRRADRERLLRACLRVIEPRGDPSFRIEVSPAGQPVRWLAVTGAAYIDEEAAVHLVGTVHDVTAEKLDEFVEAAQETTGP